MINIYIFSGIINKFNYLKKLNLNIILKINKKFQNKFLLYYFIF